MAQAVDARPDTVNPGDEQHGGQDRARRWAWGDVAFALFLIVYTSFAVVFLLAGAGAVVASASDSFHERLHEWGLRTSLLGRMSLAMADASHDGQTAAQLIVDYGFSIFNLALAGFLIWLRPKDGTARRLAVGMIGTAAIFNLQAHGVYEGGTHTTAESTFHDLFQVVAALSYIDALLRFPDGYLVPRWRGWVQALVYAPLTLLVAVLAFRVTSTSRTVALILFFGVLTPIVGVASQAYRYRRSPTPIERQQGRLMFWAFTPALLLGIFVLTQRTGNAFEDFAGRNIAIIPAELFRTFQPVFALIPVALFVGILRYRLWNIDKVISRTLVYSVLAGFVTAVYVGVVVGVGRLFNTEQDSSSLWLSIVATGIIAVAFQPVKERVNRIVNRLVYGQRATPYEVLSGLSERMAGTVATEDLLGRVARVIAEGTGARRVDVWLLFGEEARPEASWTDSPGPAPEPVTITGDTFPEIPGVTTTVPVRHRGELLGAITVVKPPNEGLTPTEERLLEDVGAQAGLLVRNVRLTAELVARLEELRASRQRLVAAQDEERRRLERNLHDGAQQQLVALKVQLGLAERLAEAGQPVAEMIRQLKEETGEALETLRDLARGIYPPLLAAEGLPSALAGQARKASFEVDIQADDVGRYPQDIETAIYFVCLEAFQNASKYADASLVRVELTERDKELRFVVTDDGAGFDPSCTPQGSGTHNMADRVEALDGSLTITSAVGAGTRVEGRIPVPADAIAPAGVDGAPVSTQ